jgi:antitoxin component of RelBE/YafQ-DinJ toxin-antitoxin module
MSPVGGEKTRLVTIRLKESTHSFFKKLAEKNGLSISDVLRIPLERFQERNGHINIVVTGMDDSEKKTK